MDQKRAPGLRIIWGILPKNRWAEGTEGEDGDWNMVGVWGAERGHGILKSYNIPEVTSFGYGQILELEVDKMQIWKSTSLICNWREPTPSLEMRFKQKWTSSPWKGLSFSLSRWYMELNFSPNTVIVRWTELLYTLSPPPPHSLLPSIYGTKARDIFGLFEDRTMLGCHREESIQ